jgi:hypothetical protein
VILQWLQSQSSHAVSSSISQNKRIIFLFPPHSQGLFRQLETQFSHPESIPGLWVGFMRDRILMAFRSAFVNQITQNSCGKAGIVMSSKEKTIWTAE